MTHVLHTDGSVAVRAPNRCTGGGHGFDSHRGLRCFSVFRPPDMLNILNLYSLHENSPLPPGY